MGWDQDSVILNISTLTEEKQNLVTEYALLTVANVMQKTTTAAETIQGKRKFEQHAKNNGVTV